MNKNSKKKSKSISYLTILLVPILLFSLPTKSFALKFKANSLTFPDGAGWVEHYDTTSGEYFIRATSKLLLANEPTSSYYCVDDFMSSSSSSGFEEKINDMLIGAIVPFAVDKSKSTFKSLGWLHCDGATYNAELQVPDNSGIYPFQKLALKIGTTWGGSGYASQITSPTGETTDFFYGTFSVPDLRGRFLRGANWETTDIDKRGITIEEKTVTLNKEPGDYTEDFFRDHGHVLQTANHNHPRLDNDFDHEHIVINGSDIPRGNYSSGHDEDSTLIPAADSSLDDNNVITTTAKLGKYTNYTNINLDNDPKTHNASFSNPCDVDTGSSVPNSGATYIDATNTTVKYGYETRPNNIGVIYCIKY
jgi:hypothetical protein